MTPTLLHEALRTARLVALVTLLVGVGAIGCAPPATTNGNRETLPSAATREPPPSTLGPVTAENFSNHPAVEESRRVAQEVAALEKDGKLNATERAGDESCENYAGDLLRTLWRDGRGKARKLTLEAGSGDSSVTVDASYDVESTLRFLFVKAAAVNDAVYEYEIYFGRDGQKLWEHRALVRGPGYTFPTPWPEEFTPRDPEARFASATTCH